ncbi:MAG TPA: UDP-N-acetylmuramoyl-L-alanyl-D-glutamate--2,6-diaminopimelate ligase [Neisseriales bacterium]|nr:UDP-N-acetylmuramoyl-L-alanyl-D-glutamate--2,6-diaminopimelate ligase [Neisseriales bacterium]
MYSLHNQRINPNTFAQLIDKLGLLLTNHALVIDSRKLHLGDIFCAYPGTATDGRKFISSAIQAGAQAILYEPEITSEPSVINFPVTNLMHYVGLLAAHQANYPSQDMLNIAITGTNGKTSISHWLNQAYTCLAQTSAIIGTTGAGIYPAVSDYASTTPDPITLQHLLNQFKRAQVDVLAMEVSSHALDQGRINGVSFSTAVFTNLTQDHLDYHHTMQEYFAAKAELFYWQGLAHGVINADDEYGQQLIAMLQTENPRLNLLSYGIEQGDLRASDIQLSTQGIKFTLHYKQQEQLIHAKIIGRFNVYNLLAVFGVLLANGIAWDELGLIAGQLKPVIGRMDATIQADKPLVVVDYSHTPDALEKALSTLGEISQQAKLICVFGCGGNRDTGKRPLMGQIATELADHVIITTDNPRHEEPAAIIQDILTGVKRSNYQVIIDRKQALIEALNQATAGDVVLVAGKGHESYQEIKGVKHHFSDLELVAELLNEKV